MSNVLFSIDNVHDVHVLAKFLRYMDTANAMLKLKTPMVTLIGSYAGELEQSFMLNDEDFKEYVLKLGFVKDQECVMIIRDEEGTVMRCFLHYISDTGRDLAYVGNLVEVGKKEALANEDGFTYRPDVNNYWILEK